MRSVISVAFISVIALSNAIILRTSDSGRTWMREPSGTVLRLNAVATDPLSGLSVAVGDAGIILRRNESGEWENVSHDDVSADLNSVATGSGLCMAVGDSGTILSSYDMGASWRVLSDFRHRGHDLLSVNFDPAYPRHFLVTGTDGFLFSTRDGGVLQTHLTGDVTGSCVSICGVFPHIAVSSEGGVLNLSLLSAELYHENPILGLTRLISGGSLCIGLGEEGLISIQSDEVIPMNISPQSRLTDIAHLSWGQTVCAVGDNGLILMSWDNGASWQQVSSGTSRSLHGVAGDGAGVGYIVGDGPFGRFLR
jgi:photosystem II stability/assembly factor-like uncharacterized protein